MRDIVAKKSAKKINGVMVDMFTASAVVKVYDAINDTNKAKMDKMTVPAMANVAFKLMKK
jgi:acyl-CoA synthetase (NDP forming)